MRKKNLNSKNKLLKLLLIFILSIPLLGCWDLIDIERRTIILATGLDKEGKNIVLTQEFTSMFAPAYQKEGDPNKIIVQSYKGITFEEVLEKAASRQPYPQFPGTVRAVVFGGNYAQQDISSFINRIDRVNDYRKSVIPVVSREPAKDILNLKSSTNIAIGHLIERSMMENLYSQHINLHGQLGRVINYESIPEIGYLIQYIGIENNDLAILGFAAIVDGKMVTTIEGNAFRGAVYLINNNFGFLNNLTNPQSNEIMALKTVGGKRDISTSFIDETVHININLNTKHVIMYQYEINPISESAQSKLEKQLAKKIKNDIEEAIKISQEDVKYDIYHFALYFRGEHPKLYKTLDWIEEFPKAKIEVTVSSEIIKKNLYDPNIEGK